MMMMSMCTGADDVCCCSKPPPPPRRCCCYFWTPQASIARDVTSWQNVAAPKKVGLLAFEGAHAPKLYAYRRSDRTHVEGVADALC